MAEIVNSIMRVAVIGAGSIAREYSLRFLCGSPYIDVVAIVDLNIEAAEALAEDVGYRKLGAVIMGDKYRETVDRSSVSMKDDQSVPYVLFTTDINEALLTSDAVYIATPPSTHCTVVEIAHAGRKHVLLEKPIAVSLDDCDRICKSADQAYREHQLITSVHIGMRFNAAVHECRARVGRVQSVVLRLQFMQWPRVWQQQPWVARRAEGGPLLEVGTHWFFAIQEILGQHRGAAVSLKDADCSMDYVDGISGVGCETSVTGTVQLEVRLPNTEIFIVPVTVIIDTANTDAMSQGKDLYELQIYGTKAENLLLFDWTKLRNGCDGTEISLEKYDIPGQISISRYGRQETVNNFVTGMRHSADGTTSGNGNGNGNGNDVSTSGADIVSCQQARLTEEIIEAIKVSARCKYD